MQRPAHRRMVGRARPRMGEHEREHMNLRRVAVVGLATATLMAISATGALAHDCFVVNRSAQGAIGAGHSPMWFSATAADGYFFIYTEILELDPSEVDLEPLVEAALVLHEEAGLPEAIAIFENHLLLTNPHTYADTPAAVMHEGDGKGIDHFSESPLGEQMVGIALSVLGP